MPSLKSFSVSVQFYTVFTADMSRYAVILTFDLWPWTFVVCRLCHGQTLYQIWAQSSNPWRVIVIWIFDPMTLNVYHVLRCAQDSLHKVYTQLSYPFTKCNDYFEANTLCHAMTLTFDPLTSKALDNVSLNIVSHNQYCITISRITVSVQCTDQCAASAQRCALGLLVGAQYKCLSYSYSSDGG